MPDRILIIDDDANLLSGLRRQLSAHFEVTATSSGEQALKAVESAEADQAPFAVALCDMRMPGMDGVETLRRIRELAPDTVRAMLTGNADQATAMDAINHGSIFRFFTKPCAPETLLEGLVAACAQYRLITAEKELLENTLTGSIKALVDIAAMNDTVVAGLATRLREWVRVLTSEFRMPHRWQLEIAATLAPIGQISLPPEILAKKRSGEPLSNHELDLIERAPSAARNIIAHIPRLSKVAEIVYLQDRGYDGSGFPSDGPIGADIPLDARLLKILKDLAEAADGLPLTQKAFAALEKQRSRYDPVMLSKVQTCMERLMGMQASGTVSVPLSALRGGQTVLSDVKLSNGRVLIPANTRLSDAQAARVECIRKIFTMIEPVLVLA